MKEKNGRREMRGEGGEGQKERGECRGDPALWELSRRDLPAGEGGREGKKKGRKQERGKGGWVKEREHTGVLLSSPPTSLWEPWVHRAVLGLALCGS